jgi:hypothetical protein
MDSASGARKYRLRGARAAGVFLLATVFSGVVATCAKAADDPRAVAGVIEAVGSHALADDAAVSVQALAEDADPDRRLLEVVEDALRRRGLDVRAGAPLLLYVEVRSVRGRARGPDARTGDASELAARGAEAWRERTRAMDQADRYWQGYELTLQTRDLDAFRSAVEDGHHGVWMVLSRKGGGPVWQGSARASAAHHGPFEIASRLVPLLVDRLGRPAQLGFSLHP